MADQIQKSKADSAQPSGVGKIIADVASALSPTKLMSQKKP